MARDEWRRVGSAFHDLSKQRRERMSDALRAFDAQSAGGSYRIIAEALFGRTCIWDADVLIWAASEIVEAVTPA